MDWNELEGHLRQPPRDGTGSFRTPGLETDAARQETPGPGTPVPEPVTPRSPAAESTPESGSYRFGPGGLAGAREEIRPAPEREEEPDSDVIFSRQQRREPVGPEADPAGYYRQDPFGAAGTPAGAWRVPGAQPGYGPYSGVYDVPRARIDDAPVAEPRRSAWWTPLLVAAALLAGLLGGFVGSRWYAPTVRVLESETPAPAWSQEISASEDGVPIGEKIVHGETGEAVLSVPAVIYEENVASVVGITCAGTTRNIWGQVTPTASSGTGFVLSADGYILTNYHVVKDADRLNVSFYDGRTLPARLVGYEAATCDVALLKVEAEDLRPVRIGNSDEIRVGDQVCAIGNPLGELSYSLTVGYISAKERAINTDGTPIGMIQTDAAINSGNSGGPLFDAAGNVIGMITAKYSGSTDGGTTVEGLGFAIPINTVINLIEDLELRRQITQKLVF